jgi:Ser/Thr protein kinase RdoA (MazF antagonist)
LGQPPYRPPAWPGLLPARPIYAPAPAAIAASIAAALDLDAPVFALKNAGGATPTFRIDAEAPLVVKLESPDGWREQREAELVAHWLSEHGAPAIAAREVAPPQLPSGEFVVSYPFAHGRPPSPTLADASAVGAGIARIHAALATYPQAADWQSRTAARLARLAAIRDALAKGDLVAGPQPDALSSLASDRSISFLPSHRSGPSRPSHGDLNIFNIVIDGGAARFLDFEDCVHSVLPPECDIALLCERVVMVQEPDDVKAAAAIEVLLGAYRDAGGDALDRAALPDVLRGLSLRSLCTLTAIDPAGGDAAEWNKFFTLIESAQRRRSIFD